MPHVRTAAQRQLDLLEIEKYSLMGKNSQAIVDILNAKNPYQLSRFQIDKDKQKLPGVWAARYKDNAAEERKKMLAKLDRMEEEVWEAWERSKQAQLTTKAASGATGKAGNSVEKRTRDPNAAYISALERIQERRAKLLGLDAPQKVEATGKDGAPIEVAATVKIIRLPSKAAGPQ